MSLTAAPMVTSAPRTVMPATTYGASFPATTFGSYPATYGTTTLAAPTYGTTLSAPMPTTTLGGSVSAPIGGSISAPMTTTPFVGGGLSLPIGAAALPPVPMLGPSYQSATYTAPTVAPAPVMGGSVSIPMSPTSPISPTTRTAVLPRSNMFSGYTATPFLAPSQYNIGTSAALSTAVSNVMGATYGSSYPGLTTGTYVSGATYPAATYPAATTYSTSAPVTTTTA